MKPSVTEAPLPPCYWSRAGGACRALLPSRRLSAVFTDGRVPRKRSKAQGSPSAVFSPIEWAGQFRPSGSDPVVLGATV